MNKELYEIYEDSIKGKQLEFNSYFEISHYILCSFLQYR